MGAMLDFVSIPVKKIRYSAVLGRTQPGEIHCEPTIPLLSQPNNVSVIDGLRQQVRSVYPPAPNLPLSQVLSLIWIHGDTEDKAPNTHDLLRNIHYTEARTT
jgi:hypothetical protein